MATPPSFRRTFIVWRWPGRQRLPLTDRCQMSPPHVAFGLRAKSFPDARTRQPPARARRVGRSFPGWLPDVGGSVIGAGRKGKREEQGKACEGGGEERLSPRWHSL